MCTRARLPAGAVVPRAPPRRRMGDFWVTPEEKAAGALEPEKLAAVVRKYEEDGLCVLCNVIEHEVLDRSACCLLTGCPRCQCGRSQAAMLLLRCS